METQNLEIIDQIIQRIDIGADRRIFFNQQPSSYTPAQVQNISVPMLVEALQNLIYTEFYTKSTFQNSNYPTPEAVHQFSKKLRDVNTSKERFDEGWTVISVDYQGVILAQKGSYKRHVQSGEYIGVSCFGRKPQQGDTLKLFVRKDYYEPEGGFYFVFGEHQAEQNLQQNVRFYFNIKAEGSTRLVEQISTQLNLYQVPFQFKCLNHESLYQRADSAVLYLEKRYCSLTMRLLSAMIDTIKPYLKPDVPAFTLKLHDGIGFAENPLNPNESFGTNLSKVIANGIVSAVNQRMPKNLWKQEILKQIQLRHLNINQLYLNPNTQFPYQFSIPSK
ncbi:MAG: T3SS effector HopA1 family protein [Arcicella sp.]|jgi:hypothetical protein|nr:T3SS effector HopA1 family protein [Arcicella sp.]